MICLATVFGSISAESMRKVESYTQTLDIPVMGIPREFPVSAELSQWMLPLLPLILVTDFNGITLAGEAEAIQRVYART